MALERVQKILANNGVCSRRDGERMIEQGRVKVNDKLIKLGDKADLNKDTITVDNIPVKPKNKLYLAYNKPRGVITALYDLFDRKTLTDTLPMKERIFHIGRLDRDVSGLLLLTNDGELANRIMHPRYEVKKTYFVNLDKRLKPEDRAAIEKGVYLKEGRTSKCKVIVQGPMRVLLEVHEGKNKIVKRIFNEVGYNVNKLRRIKVANIELGNLKPGQWRDLTKQELSTLKKILHMQ